MKNASLRCDTLEIVITDLRHIVLRLDDHPLDVVIRVTSVEVRHAPALLQLLEGEREVRLEAVLNRKDRASIQDVHLHRHRSSRHAAPSGGEPCGPTPPRGEPDGPRCSRTMHELLHSVQSCRK